MLAYLFMIIDHFGQSFFPEEIIFRVFGLFAFPLFALRICDGYKYTSNFWNYIKRILIIGLISQPFQIWVYNLWTLNVFFTLMFGLLLLKFIETYKSDKLLVVFMTSLIIIISWIYPFFLFGSWGLITILCFYYLREDLLKFITIYISLTIFINVLDFIFHNNPQDKLLLFIFLPLILKVNHIRWNFNLFGYKYWHYAIFPGHLLVIALIKMFV